MDLFSRHQGLIRPDAEIKIRYEAPKEMRDAAIQISYQCGLEQGNLRTLLCEILLRAPNRDNWSEFPNIDSELRELTDDCEWFEVYDLIEKLTDECAHRGHDYAEEVNRFFHIAGVGWQLIGSRVEMRATEIFEVAVCQNLILLREQKRMTAASELHEALNDLSRRPYPETTGAIQHAMATLEYVARDVTGGKDTLGQLVQRNSAIFPTPINQIVEKAWGYTSNYGRHLREGQPPQFEETELMVGISGVLCRYLSRKVLGRQQ